MPSHSSRGGSGSSIGGFGGGNSGNTGGFNPNHGPVPPMGPYPRTPRFFHSPVRFHFFGRPVFVTSNGQMGFAVGIFLFIFAIIAMFVSVGILSSCKTNLNEVNFRIKTLEAQNAGYIKLVSEVSQAYSGDDTEFDADLWKSKIPQDESILTDDEKDKKLDSQETEKTEEEEQKDPKKGVAVARYSKKIYTGYEYEKNEMLTGMFEYKSDYSKVSRFFIRYAYTVNGQIVFGETFAEFMPSMTNVNEEGFNEIKIAYQYVEKGETPIDQGDASYARIYGYDSINLDFEGIVFEIEEANLYLLPLAQSSLKAAKTTLLVVGIILGIIVVTILIAIIITIKNSKAKQAEYEQQKKVEAEEREEAKKEVYCKYCGAKISSNEAKCPNCGASQFEKK